MRFIKNIKTICCAALLLGAMSSCSDWLDVKMEDNVMENTLFSTNEGYQVALNGVYLSLVDLYANNLTAGAIDVMAQYYNVTENNNHTYKVYAGYKFDDTQFESFRDNVWTKAYELIANTNVILEHCAEEGNALKKEHAPIVKGEALALRALLHFEMLRLFGPVYNAENASVKCIPYNLSSSKDIQPLLPASEVMDYIITDLTEAASLMKTADPIVTEGIRNEEQNDNGLGNDFLNYRNLRLNYYAVQALLARAYAWKGDMAKAYSICKNDIIDKITTDDVEVFPWVTESQIRVEGKPDYVFSSEVMFALYNTKRTSVFSSLFSPSLNAKSSRLTFVGSSFSDSKYTFFYDDENDWRREMWGVTESKPTEDDTEVETSLYLLKFADFEQGTTASSTDLYRYMMPLVRLSEVYLLAAEGAPSREEGIGYINTLRKHRSCRDIADNGEEMVQLVLNEFAREVIGEGQLFYFYKRHAMENIPSGTAINATFGMTLSNYVLPLPPSETDKRVTINNNSN